MGFDLRRCRLFSKRAIVLATALLTALLLPFSVSADSDYYLTDNQLYLQFTPKTYTLRELMLSVDGGSGALYNPEDIFIDGSDHVYIVDTNNNRVLKFSSDMKLLQTIPSPDNTDPEASLSQPQGVYVSPIGDCFVADTGHQRIVHYDAAGLYVEKFTQPTDPIFDADTGFNPSKLYIDKYGIMYVINAQDYHGVTTLDARGDFLGYIGAVKNPFDLANYIVRAFASQTQLDQLQKVVPPYYSNITSNGDGTLYATTNMEKRDQIKRLTQAGKNVYPPRFYGESNNSELFQKLPAFCDVAVTKDGIVFAADSVTGMIYVNDQQGNSLAVLGGDGLYKGRFASVSSIAVNSKNELYVLDRKTGAVQILAPTEFMDAVLSGITLYNNGHYDEALPYWEKVLDMDPTYTPAELGKAKSLLRANQSAKALDAYREALSQKGYSGAFEQIRSDFFRTHFLLVVLLILLPVLGLLFGIPRVRRYADRVVDRGLPQNDRYGLRFFGETSVSMIFHPIDGFDRLKRNRKRVPIWTLVAMLAIIVAEKLLFWRLIHFPLSTQYIFVDYFQDMAVFFTPFVSWIVVSYAMTSISEGKQTFKETVAANLYSFVPFMVLYLPITALTNVMSRGEQGIYNFLSFALLAWCLLLVFTNLKVMNEYSFGKAVATVLKILLAILALWLIVFLSYIIVSQLFSFVFDIFKESTLMGK